MPDITGSSNEFQESRVPWYLTGQKSVFELYTSFVISHWVRGGKTAAAAQHFMYAGRTRETIGAGLLGWVNGGETWTPERNLTPVITERLSMRNIISPGVDWSININNLINHNQGIWTLSIQRHQSTCNLLWQWSSSPVPRDWRLTAWYLDNWDLLSASSEVIIKTSKAISICILYPGPSQPVEKEKWKWKWKRKLLFRPQIALCVETQRSQGDPHTATIWSPWLTAVLHKPFEHRVLHTHTAPNGAMCWLYLSFCLFVDSKWSARWFWCLTDIQLMENFGCVAF